MSDKKTPEIISISIFYTLKIVSLFHCLLFIIIVIIFCFFLKENIAFGITYTNRMTCIC